MSKDLFKGQVVCELAKILIGLTETLKQNLDNLVEYEQQHFLSRKTADILYDFSVRRQYYKSLASGGEDIVPVILSDQITYQINILAENVIVTSMMCRACAVSKLESTKSKKKKKELNKYIELLNSAIQLTENGAKAYDLLLQLMSELKETTTEAESYKGVHIYAWLFDYDQDEDLISCDIITDEKRYHDLMCKIAIPIYDGNAAFFRHEPLKDIKNYINQPSMYGGN